MIFCFLLLLSKMSAFFLSFLSPSCHSGGQIPRGVLCRVGLASLPGLSDTPSHCEGCFFLNRMPGVSLEDSGLDEECHTRQTLTLG